MAKKRRARRSSRTSRARRTRSKSVSRRARAFKPAGNRVGLVLKNLVVFLVLALVAYVLSLLITNDVLNRLLAFLALVFVFLGVAFLIVLLVMLVLRSMKSKRRR